jgi:hypothetical protein
MTTPKCEMCGKSDKVVVAIYGRRRNPVWKGYECERCNCVVKELLNEGE